MPFIYEVIHKCSFTVLVAVDNKSIIMM